MKRDIWAIRHDYTTGVQNKYKINYSSYNIQEKYLNYSEGVIRMLNNYNHWIEELIQDNVGVDIDKKIIWYVAVQSKEPYLRDNELFSMYLISSSNYSYKDKSTVINLVDIFDSGNNRLNLTDVPLWTNPIVHFNYLEANVRFKMQDSPDAIIKYIQKNYLNTGNFLTEVRTRGNAGVGYEYDNSSINQLFMVDYTNVKLSDIWFDLQKKLQIVISAKYDMLNNKSLIFIDYNRVLDHKIWKYTKDFIVRTSNVKTNKEKFRYLAKVESSKTYNRKIAMFDVNDDLAKVKQISANFPEISTNKKFFKSLTIDDMSDEQLANIRDFTPVSINNIDNMNDNFYTQIVENNDLFKVGDLVNFEIAGIVTKIPIFEIEYNSNDKTIDVTIGRSYNNLKKRLKTLIKGE